ncbi:hypothetical protein PVS23_002867 [Escherichia coli]|nr:hypothetical protein [Escherichia coli]
MRNRSEQVLLRPRQRRRIKENTRSNDPEIIVIKQKNNYKKSLIYPVLQADETPLQIQGSLIRVLVLYGLFQRGRMCGGIFSGDARPEPLVVDGNAGNVGLVFHHLLQSEEALTLTFLSRCFEFISQSLQWFVIHNLTFF